ncbi:hypothetical protein WA026_008374 [Henosepilachna vigintioctopunctata]|uniref:Uncharacterized protein n=1 Tax=Henosepilachna vigintioctopunctata TaxID=420089 RepID=A0AAW1UI82_9CUCU
MNINIQVKSSENPQQKKSSVKVEPEQGKKKFILRLNKFVENMCEVKTNGNAHIEDPKNSFLNNLERLGEHCGKQKAQNIGQNENFEELQRPNKIAKADLRKCDDNMNFLRKHYKNLQQIYENFSSSTDNDRDQTLHDYMKIKRYYEEQEAQSKLQIEFLNNENTKLKKDLVSCSIEIDNLKKDISDLTEHNKELRERYEQECDYNTKEIESLKAILEIKKKEVAELRTSLYQVTEEVEAHAADKKKIAILQAKCDDLQFQLQSRKEYETMLRIENEQLEFSIREETHRSQNLSFRNDELEWKLRMFEDSLEDNLGKPVKTEMKNSHASLAESPLNCKSTTNDLNGTIATSTLEESHLTLKEKFSLVLKISNIVEKPKSVSYFVKIIERPVEIASTFEAISSRNY